LNKGLIMIGSGGHARVLASIIAKLGHRLDYVSTQEKKITQKFKNIKHVTDSYIESDIDPNKYLLINGIGPNPYNNNRRDIYKKFKDLSFNFATVISKDSLIDKDVKVSEGVQILDGVQINTGSKIGIGTVVNSKSSIDHDCDIGEHNNISPGVVICGGVKTSTQVYIGAGAVIANGINIYRNSVIGAGVSVVNDIKQDTIILPAKNIVKSNERV